MKKRPVSASTKRRESESSAVSRSSDIADNFKSLGIDIDPETVERMAKLGMYKAKHTFHFILVIK